MKLWVTDCFLLLCGGDVKSGEIPTPHDVEHERLANRQGVPENDPESSANLIRYFMTFYGIAKNKSVSYHLRA